MTDTPESRTPADRVRNSIAACLEDRLAPDTPVCIGYSGGVDSTVLLHVLRGLADEGRISALRALHVNHGLQRDAGEWSAHCSRYCRRIGVPYTEIAVKVAGIAEQGLEAAAREARYRAIRAELGPREVLLTAHHREDQLETYLLQLLRGAGPHGLAAMPVWTERWRVPLLRPMLGISAADIRACAEQTGLQWVEDPSNTDTRHDRNFLRHAVLPQIRRRWPAADVTVARAARLAADSAELLDELAAIDSQGALAGNCLKLARLVELTPARQRNLLRFALRRLNLPVPSELRLRTALAELLTAGADRMPEAAWPGARLRRYRRDLWMLAEPEGAAGSEPGSFRWTGQGPLEMGPVRGSLELQQVNGLGVAARLCEFPLTVSFRQGGETLRPAAAARTRHLKNLLQERAVVPWMRSHIPLIYSGDKLLAVGDIWINHDWAAASGEPGFVFRWADFAPYAGPFTLSAEGLSGNL